MVVLQINAASVTFPPPVVDSSSQKLLRKPKDYYQWTAAAVQVALDLRDDRAILCVGHMGTGKSSLMSEIAARIGQPFIAPPMNEGTQLSDLLGTYLARGGETVWVDGPLTMAMRNGWWFCFDELDFLNPKVQSAFNALAEPKDSVEEPRMFILKEKDGEIIFTHSNFRIMGTANTLGPMSRHIYMYQGANPPNMAQLDRFDNFYWIKPLPKDQEFQVLKDRFKVKTEGEMLLTKMLDVAIAARDAFEAGKMQFYFSPRRLASWARKINVISKEKESLGIKKTNTLFDLVMMSVESSVLNFCTDENDREAIIELLKHHFMKKTNNAAP